MPFLKRSLSGSSTIYKRMSSYWLNPGGKLLIVTGSPIGRISFQYGTNVTSEFSCLLFIVIGVAMTFRVSLSGQMIIASIAAFTAVLSSVLLPVL